MKGVLCKELTSSQHVERFENSLHELIDVELEQIGVALDSTTNDRELASLWYRWDQLHLARAVIERNYLAHELPRDNQHVLLVDY